VPSLRLQLRRLSLIAFLAVFGFAFAPTLSHALAAAQPWAELCSSADDGQARAPAPAALQFAHCPLCALGAGAAPLPPGGVAVFVAARQAAVLPAFVLQAPRRAQAWAAAQPRAPPLQA